MKLIKNTDHLPGLSKKIILSILLTCLVILLVAPSASPSQAAGIVPTFLGVIPGRYINGDAIVELYAMDAWAGKASSLVEISLDIQEANGGYDIPTQLNFLWDYGYTPFINLVANIGSPSAYQIASGVFDSALNQWAQIYANWAQAGKFAFIAILPEMNVPWYSYGMDATNYRLAFTHIRQVFAQNNVPTEAVRWVFAPNGWFNNPFEAYYPGDEWVDVVGFSAYNFGYCPNNPEYWAAPEAVFGGHINALRTLAPSKPIFITRMGSSAYIQPGQVDYAVKNQWLREAYSYLENRPGVQAIIYDNTNNSWDCDWLVYQSGGAQFSGYPEAVTQADLIYLSPQDLGEVDLSLDLPRHFLPLVMHNFDTHTSDFPIMSGIYTGDWMAQDIIDLKLHALDNWAGKGASIAGLFIDIENPSPDTHITGQLNLIWDNGYVPFVNLTAMGRSAYDIASGVTDADLRVWARAYKNYALNGERAAFIAPLEEMDGFWVPYGLDPANFKLAYWRIQTIFAEEGVPANSVYWVFAPTGYNHHSYPPFEDYYPGHETVDVVGFSSYNFGYCPVDEYPDWLTPEEQLGEFIRRMEVMAPGKAVFITQFAASSYVSPGNNDDSVKSQWLEDAYTYLASYESVKAALYFNLDNGCDWAFYNTWDGNSRQLVGYRDGISIPAYEYVTPSELSFSGFFKTTP